MAVEPSSEFNAAEAKVLGRYFTNLDRPVFALRNLPEVVKGALFSRYSRTEKSLRRVLLDEFINEPDSGFEHLAGGAVEEDMVAVRRAEEFYERVLVGYGDDSVAELAGAHVAVEQVSMLGAKAVEDSRIGISPLEKSTRYVRFDRLARDGRYLYYRGDELSDPLYARAMDALFETYSRHVEPATLAIRERYPQEPGETDRAWKSATRAKALDLLRGLLPAGALTNLGVYGNGRAFEYLITKLSAHELAECRQLATDLHQELSLVIPSFVRRALDEKYGGPAAERMATIRARTARLARRGAAASPQPPGVRLVDFDPDAERKVVAAALFPHSNLPLDDQSADPHTVLEALLGDRANRRQRVPRALEHAEYTFEVTANFAAYRDLHRHRMLTQDRQVLGTQLGFQVPPGVVDLGIASDFQRAVEGAAAAHAKLEREVGAALAQYAVPMAYEVRWYVRANLREIYHLCELRTTPQGHPDYRWIAQEMFRRVNEVHPKLAGYARFVDLGPGDELERRGSERRLDEKRRALDPGVR